MGFRDYNSSASLNTTIAGINVAENMARGDVNNAIRQLMADAKASTIGAAISIKDYGAVCDGGTTSDNTALVNAVAAGHKRIYIPNGTTLTAGALTFTSVNGVHLVGDGVQASVVSVLGTTGDVLTFSGCQDSGVIDVGFQYVNEPTSGYVLKFTGSCFEPVATVRMDYHYNGIWVESGTEPRLDVVSRYGFGSVPGVVFGNSTAGVYGASMLYHGDMPPATSVTDFKTYAALTAFTLGQVTIANSKIYVCTQAGTTGAASSPSTTSGNRFLTDITDGTVKWRFVCRSDATHIIMDSNAYSVRITHSFGLNGAYTFRMMDTLATGTSYPKWAYLGLESDHAVQGGISLEAGEGVYLNDNAWVGSCLNGNGIQAITSFRGELSIDATVRVLGNAQHGLLLNVGSVYDIQGIYSGNSVSSSGTYHGISTGSNVTDYLIRATCGRARSGGATQGYGISIGATNDRYAIKACNLTGNATGTILGHTASASKVYDAIDTGWTVGTGTPLKSAFAAYGGATMSAGYVQAEAQATNDAARNASQRVLALEVAARAAGIISA